MFFFSSRRRHTRCALVTGVQTCALPISERGYPVLYVLDGNAAFAAFAQARWVQEHDAVGQSIVVGVGYPTDQPYAAQRAEDFIVMDNPPPGTRLGRTAGRSGRDEFLDFLTGKLRAEIGKSYRTDPARQALFVHSFGGDRKTAVWGQRVSVRV